MRVVVPEYDNRFAIPTEDGETAFVEFVSSDLDGAREAYKRACAIADRRKARGLAVGAVCVHKRVIGRGLSLIPTFAEARESIALTDQGEWVSEPADADPSAWRVVRTGTKTGRVSGRRVYGFTTEKAARAHFDRFALREWQTLWLVGPDNLTHATRYGVREAVAS